MSTTATKGAESLLEAKVHRFAYCWELARTDGITYRFTDHDHQLTLLDGSIFVPQGGFSATAKQRQVNLKENNFEIKGIFDNAYITYDDIRAGRYRDAKLTEYVVDWLYPWAGAFTSNVWWISNTRIVDNTWEAQLSGFSVWLKKSVGKLAKRTCSHILGDAGCTLALGPFTFTGTVNAVVNSNIKFTTTGGAAAKADAYFDYGKLTWTTGPNVGIVSEVRRFLNASGTFALQIRTPFGIANGDQFSAVAGDDKLSATCKTKFSNLVNFDGVVTIPGTDKMLQSPKTKNVD